MKNHLNTSTYHKVDTNSDKNVFNNLKYLLIKCETYLTKNETNYILKSSWNLYIYKFIYIYIIHIYILPKVHKSKKIAEGISDDICINMEPSADLKEHSRHLPAQI